jgi:hypothetical protein
VKEIQRQKREPALHAKPYNPISTSKIMLTPELHELIEELGRNTREVWSAKRMPDGWSITQGDR